MNCWDKPTILETWPENACYLMAIDENGTHTLKGLRRKLDREIEIPQGDRFFTATGVVMKRKDFPTFRKSITAVKSKSWPPDGCYNGDRGHRKVCFHSSEIRGCKGPFNLVNPQQLHGDISSLIKGTPFYIYSATVDKVTLIQKYPNPWQTYRTALELILERFCLVLNRYNLNTIVLLESRGENADNGLLEKVIALKENDSYYYNAEHFRHIIGVYFNPKWCPGHKDLTYISLELADLCSYPLYRYCTDGCETDFLDVIEPKLYGYPNYWGKGLKKFP